jgi:hypothetical protein
VDAPVSLVLNVQGAIVRRVRKPHRESATPMSGPVEFAIFGSLKSNRSYDLPAREVLVFSAGGLEAATVYDINARPKRSWITDGQTPAADHRLQRASHHGHLTDPDKEPTAASVDFFSVLRYQDALARNFR